MRTAYLVAVVFRNEDRVRYGAFSSSDIAAIGDNLTAVVAECQGVDFEAAIAEVFRMVRAYAFRDCIWRDVLADLERQR